jgi:hypothetical protein
VPKYGEVYDLYSAYAGRFRIVAGQREEQHELHRVGGDGRILRVQVAHIQGGVGASIGAVIPHKLIQGITIG